jgi:hypothetical protein
MSVIKVGALQDLSGNTDFDLTNNIVNATTLNSTTINNSGNIVTTNVNGANPNRIVQMSGQTATGTSVDFTGIPNWVKRITVGYYNITTNNSSSFIMLQLGTSGTGVTTSGYTSQAATNTGGGVVSNGLNLASQSGSTSYTLTGQAVLTQLGNFWIYSSVTNFTNVTSTGWIASGNAPVLSGSLDRVRFTTSTGASLTNGTVQVLYEG